MEDQKGLNEQIKEKDINAINSIAVKNTESSSLSVPSNDFQYIEQLAAQLDNMKAIASVFVKGGLCPLKKEEDFIVATTMGNQLGLPMMTAVNNIFMVSGKPALATHLLRALLLKAGIVFNKVADNEPMFAYYEAEEVNGKMEAIKIDGVPIQRGIAITSEIDTTKFKAGRNPVDYITKYVFERKIRQADGSFKDIKVVSEFKRSDAARAGLLSRDTYTNYPGRMFDARAFAIGAREIGADVLFGMYTISELADAKNIKYSMSENFEETIQDVDVEVLE